MMRRIILLYFIYTTLFVFDLTECRLVLNVNGVKIRCEVTKFGFCMEAPVRERLVLLERVSVNECIFQCVARPKCLGLNYRRLFKLCQLLSGVTGLLSPGECMYIHRSDITVENLTVTCKELCDGLQICDQGGKCVVKGNHACQYPNVTNGRPTGNMFAVGDTQVIECNHGLNIYGSSTIKCMEDGTWNTLPECKKDCNVSNFNNADVMPFSNTSGSFAVVTCFEDYISNRTESTDNMITEETVACDNTGKWIPSIDCIYVNNFLNIALAKPTSQSSNYGSAVSSRATDGVWDPFFRNGSCSNTNIDAETIAWWEVNLLQKYDIRRLKILTLHYDYFESRFRNVTITVGKVPNPKEVCALYIGPASSGQILDIVCDKPISGQYVRLSKSNTGPFQVLAMCEVAIYEK